MKGPRRFGDFELKYYNSQTAKVAILPVPYDKTSTWIKGAAKGPEAILAASYNLEFYDIETDSEVFRKGIYTEPAIEGFDTPEQMAKAVRGRVDDILKR
ncbi:MAG: arginase family protein, partial [Planctomycetota bacterium]